MNEPEKQERIEPENRSSEEAGRKGGAASVAAGRPVLRAEVVSMAAGDVRWGSVWVGVLVALPIQLVLSGIGIAMTLRSYAPVAANYGQRISNMLGMWSAVSMLISLFIGGYIASRMASATGSRNGWLQGSLVWALAMLIGVALGARGAIGFSGIQSMLSTGTPLAGGQVGNQLMMAGNATWWFVIAAVLSWITAVTGGLVGNSARDVER